MSNPKYRAAQLLVDLKQRYDDVNSRKVVFVPITEKEVDDVTKRLLERMAYQFQSSLENRTSSFYIDRYSISFVERSDLERFGILKLVFEKLKPILNELKVPWKHTEGKTSGPKLTIQVSGIIFLLERIKDVV